MRVCIVGSGGREHALAHVLARTADVVVTPGNPGMAPPIEVTEDVVEEVEADLYVIGPEAPLVAGLADRLRARGKAVMGPGADGALLEGSKAFMKEVLRAAGVPTARFATFDALETDAALAFLETLPGPWVIKTDGLASGKGVLVAETLGEARADVEREALWRVVRRRRAPHRDRGGARGGGVLAARPVRRHPRRATGPGPGLQADRRRRPGPQHRGYGRLRADAADRRRRGGAPDGGRRDSPGGGVAAARHRLPGRALRRPHVDGRRAQGH